MTRQKAVLDEIEADPEHASRGGQTRSPTSNDRAHRARPHSLRELTALDRIQVIALGDSAQELAEGAAAAEAAGVEGVWAIELYRSTFTQATWLAAKTESIGIGTGITWAFTRSPFLLAVSALDIDEMSGGRFRLGLGAGVKRLNERWHGAEYGRPAPHLRETVEATRLIMESANAGAPIRYEGSTTTSTSRAGPGRIPPCATRFRSTSPRSARGWRGWPVTSPTGCSAISSARRAGSRR